MNKSVRYLALFIACFTTCFSSKVLFGAQNGLPVLHWVDQPAGMQPASAVIPSKTGLVTYTVKPNTKDVMTNESKIKASIIDLSDSMKDSQRRIFDSCRIFSGHSFVPMLVSVTNDSDKAITVAPDVLANKLGLSVDDVKDAMIKMLKFKKYGAYAANIIYDAFMLALLSSVAVYFPYVYGYNVTNFLFTCAGACSSAVVSCIGALPACCKCLAGATGLGLSLKFLTPSLFMNLSHRLIDKCYGIKASFEVPWLIKTEYNQAIDFVIASSKKTDMNVDPKSSKQFMIFVRSEDATNIKNGRTFPALDFEFAR